MVNRPAAASSHDLTESANKVARFPNLRTAGNLLAEELRDRDCADAVVIAIACAGVPVGREVATLLGLPFDILLNRRLLAPDGPGSQIGVVSVAGTMVFDDGIELPTDPSSPIEHFIFDAMNQFRERVNTCRPGRSPVTITDRKIVLVDCAIHTGATMKLALRSVRRLRPAQIIAAVPVGSRDGCALIEGDADQLICLTHPEPFGNSAMWYKTFDRPGDEDVPKFLDVT